jgi:DNA-binding MarR family transcriptional regulator
MPDKNGQADYNSIIGKIETLIYHINIDNTEAKLFKDCLDENGINALDNIAVNLAECHMLACIEDNKPINAVGIAKQLNMTRGGISKIAARLRSKRMITMQHIPDNRKEIFYSLTPLGKQIYQIHNVLHQKTRGRLTNLLSKYNDDELILAGKFLSDLVEAYSNESVG